MQLLSLSCTDSLSTSAGLFYLEDGMTFKILQHQTKSKAGFPRALFLPFPHPQNSGLYLETMSSFMERALK